MNKEQEDYEKEEWGGWKIVSDMLDNEDENGIYPTSDCYQKLYDFVVSQKKKALEQQKKEYERAEILGVQLLFKKSRTKKDLENLIEFSKNDVKYSNNVIKICEEKIKQME